MRSNLCHRRHFGRGASDENFLRGIGGVGGLTLFDKAGLAIPDTETFFTGNVGGGVKWFNGRWGLRADYRFTAVRSKDDAPAFFGQETRYGHRIYGAVLIRAGR